MSRFSPHSLFFSTPRVIRSNCHLPVVICCLRHAATLPSFTSLTRCQPPLRSFTTTPCRSIKTVEAARSRARSGPFSVTAGVVFLTAAAGGYVYFQNEKARLERQRIAEAAKGVGRPKVGGAFELVDHEGKSFSDGDMKGGFSLVYFGFTHCPDICPEELDKMSRMIDLVSPSPEPTSSPSSSSLSTSAPSSSTSARSGLLPLFITCDPARDTPSVLKSYLSEFHPSILGLTGTWEQIRQVCKAYRVYFSTPEGVKPGMDYLVDHNPDGDFIEAIGRQHSAEKASRIIKAHMSDWKDGKKLS